MMANSQTDKFITKKHFLENKHVFKKSKADKKLQNITLKSIKLKFYRAFVC